MGAVEHAITATHSLNSDQHGLVKTIPSHTERMNSGKELGKIIIFKLCTHRRSKEGLKKDTISQIVEKQSDCIADHLQYFEERVIWATALSMY